MNNIEKVALTLFLLALFAFGFYFITDSITRYTGFSVFDDTKTSLCLSEKNITLFINSDNSALSLEKIEAKEYLSAVKIMNCNNNRQFCNNEGINYFPMWKIEGKKIESDISTKDLLMLADCN